MTRPRYVAIVAAAFSFTFLGADAVAQLDPGMIAQGQVIAGTARGYAERGGWRDRGVRSSTNRTAQTCANVPRVRARLGAGNPKVQELARLCRKAGY